MKNNIYIKNEAKIGFKNWTKEGLGFLLLYPSLSKQMGLQIESKLKGNTNEFSKTRR